MQFLQNTSALSAANATSMALSFGEAGQVAAAAATALRCQLAAGACTRSPRQRRARPLACDESLWQVIFCDLQYMARARADLASCMRPSPAVQVSLYQAVPGEIVLVFDDGSLTSSEPLFPACLPRTCRAAQPPPPECLL